MSSLRTFITALKTGQTRTTRALNRISAERNTARGRQLIEALREEDALGEPLREPLRGALRGELPEIAIEECIDQWPDDLKEWAREEMIWAIDNGWGLEFAWGITEADTYETEISYDGGVVKITAFSPRSTLSTYDEDQVNVGPVRKDRVRAQSERG
jgi:hypothetical protein